jgi:hypothetical protein
VVAPPEGDPDDIKEQVHTFCGACHRYPPPSNFPRRHWKHEVERGYAFYEQFGLNLRPPPIQAVIKYYEEKAEEELPPAEIHYATTPPPVVFQSGGWAAPIQTEGFAIANVNLVHLFDDKRLDILACDMKHGLVLVLRPYLPEPKWQVLSDKVANPAHAEVVDLDGDGIKDILVANLGSFRPTDNRCGSVVWLRGNKDGTFTPHTLLQGVGRVADVQAAHFFGRDKLDLVVAEFGWIRTGKILLLENQTTDWSRPKFVSRVKDDRHGTIHVPVIDLNGDGKPDFIALISQEHETIVAFLNEGNGNFRKETIWTAPHPTYGSSGIQLVDINGDGHVDVLYTNGDTLDEPYLYKPYHSVQWLENPGNGTFPWKHHEIGKMYGVHRAVAGNLAGTGRMDVVAVSFLPELGFPDRKKKDVDSIVLFAQTGPGTFERHRVEGGTADYVTCVLGDVRGIGQLDLVVGQYGSTQTVNRPVTLWQNLGKRGR